MAERYNSTRALHQPEVLLLLDIYCASTLDVPEAVHFTVRAASFIEAITLTAIISIRSPTLGAHSIAILDLCVYYS